MKKEILEKWLESLESDRYRYKSGNLRTSEGFCPLGVLCDISELSKWEVYSDNNLIKKYSYFKQSKYLPKEVAKWAGMSYKEAGDISALVMAIFDQTKSLEKTIHHIKKGYNLI